MWTSIRDLTDSKLFAARNPCTHRIFIYLKLHNRWSVHHVHCSLKRLSPTKNCNPLHTWTLLQSNNVGMTLNDFHISRCHPKTGWADLARLLRQVDLDNNLALDRPYFRVQGLASLPECWEHSSRPVRLSKVFLCLFSNLLASLNMILLVQS